MIERFEAEIKERTKDKVKVERKIRIGDPTAGFKLDDDPGVFDAGRSEGPPHHVWVEQMENFRSALISIHDVLKNKAPPSRIKVFIYSYHEVCYFCAIMPIYHDTYTSTYRSL